MLEVSHVHLNLLLICFAWVVIGGLGAASVGCPVKLEHLGSIRYCAVVIVYIEVMCTIVILKFEETVLER